MESTCLEPGETDMLTLSAMVFPFRSAAAFIISCSEEFVQDPMQT